jgi:hypothetical protein
VRSTPQAYKFGKRRGQKPPLTPATLQIRARHCTKSGFPRHDSVVRGDCRGFFFQREQILLDITRRKRGTRAIESIRTWESIPVSATSSSSPCSNSSSIPLARSGPPPLYSAATPLPLTLCPGVRFRQRRSGNRPQAEESKRRPRSAGEESERRPPQGSERGGRRRRGGQKLMSLKWARDCGCVRFWNRGGRNGMVPFIGNGMVPFFFRFGKIRGTGRFHLCIRF